MDECDIGTDNCDNTNGACTNIDASFTCTCNTGYAGDGVTCTGIHISVLFLWIGNLRFVIKILDIRLKQNILQNVNHLKNNVTALVFIDMHYNHVWHVIKQICLVQALWCITQTSTIGLIGLNLVIMTSCKWHRNHEYILFELTLKSKDWLIE